MMIVNPTKSLIDLARILEELKIDYYITGGVAVTVWGRPRATFDIDVVVKVLESQLKNLGAALKSLSKFGYFDEETAKEEVRRQGEFNFIDPDSGIKIDFWVARRNEDTLREFQRRVKKQIDGHQIYFISPEDLILSKLKWYQKSNSSRHLEDIESVLKISGDKLDIDYLRKRASELGFLDLLNNLSGQ